MRGLATSYYINNAGHYCRNSFVCCAQSQDYSTMQIPALFFVCVLNRSTTILCLYTSSMITQVISDRDVTKGMMTQRLQMFLTPRKCQNQVNSRSTLHPVSQPSGIYFFPFFFFVLPFSLIVGFSTITVSSSLVLLLGVAADLAARVAAGVLISFIRSV